MKDLKAFLAVGVAMATLSSCSSDRPSHPTYGNPNGPVPVRCSKDGAHRAYDGENGRIIPSSAAGSSMYDNRNVIQNGNPNVIYVPVQQPPQIIIQQGYPAPVMYYPGYGCGDALWNGAFLGRAIHYHRHRRCR